MGKSTKRYLKMKLSFWFILFMPYFLLSQKEYDTEIESNSKPGILWYMTFKTSNKPKSRKYDRFVLDIFYSDIINEQNLSKKSLNSIGVNTNIINEFALNKKNTLSIASGLGLSFSKVFLNNNFVLNDQNRIECFPSVTESGYHSNSLNACNFNIPFEFRYRTKGWQHTKIHIGGKIGYQLAFKEKYYHSDPTRNYRITLKSAAELLTYSIHARVGIRNYAVFASYNLNPVFKHEESPKLNWLQVGMSISLF